MLQNKVVKNAFWVIGCRIVQSLMSFIIGIISARYLGPSNFGLISYAQSIVAFVVPIMNIGLSATLVHELINNPEKEGEILGSALFASFIMSFVTIGMVISFVLIANPGEKDTLIVCALCSIMLIAQSIEIVQYWFQSKLQSKYVSIVFLFAFCIVAVYKVFLLVTNKSVQWFAVSNAFDYFIIAITLLILYKKKGTQKLSFSFGTLKSLVKNSKFYIVSNLMVAIFAQTDRIMIKLMIDESATGFYTIATTCSNLTGFVFVAIIDSFRPLIFESKKENENKFIINMQKLFCVIIYLSLMQSLFVFVFSTPIVKLLYGNEYLSSISPLRIVVWYTTFSYLGAVRNVWILAEKKQKYLWILNLCGAMLNIILNYLLIPVWGISGAAFASLVTQIFTNIIMNQIIKEIRPVNKLMLGGLNPKLLKGIFKTIVSNKKSNLD